MYRRRFFLPVGLFSAALATFGCRAGTSPAPQAPAADTSLDRPDADAPIVLPDRPFDFQASTLENGMQVISLEDHSTPIVAVQIWYHVGSKDEQPHRRGFAHMFEHMMFRGTQNIGPKAHFEYIRKVGGGANAYTSFDNTTYIQVVPSNQLDMVMWLEAERMAFLKINEEYFDIERKVVAEEYRLGQEQPYGTALAKVLDGMFDVHPYRWSPIGDMDDLAEAEADELQAFWNTYYVPNNAAVVVVGDVDHETVKASAEQYFGWIPEYPAPPRIEVREPPQTEPKQIRIKERNGPVPVVGLAYRTVPTGHRDEMALEMLGLILGGGESSRIWQDLVLDQDLAMLALSSTYSLEHDGFFAAGAVLSPFGGTPDKTLSAVRAQIEAIKANGVREDEVAKARTSLLAADVESLMTVQSKAQRLGEAAVIKRDLESVNSDFKAIATVTAADVQRVANAYLKPEREIEIRIEPNLLGFFVDQFRGKKSADENESGGSNKTEEIRGDGVGKPDLKRPDTLALAPPVRPPLSASEAGLHSERAWVETTLSNGLRVTVIPNDEVPYLHIWLGLEYGAFADPPQKPGTAYLALPMLTRGTETYTYKELVGELDRHAIRMVGSANLDFAGLSVGALNAQADRALRLLAEVVQAPTFPADELQDFVNQTTTGLMVSERSPDYLADRELRKRLFGDHPAARLPEATAAQLRNITREDLARWWQTYARPDASTLYIAGSVDPDEAVELAQAHFASWTPDGPRPQVELPELPAPQPTKVYLVDRSSSQSQIRVAQTSISRADARYPTARVVSEYFGGSFTARLNDTIRVQKGLTYGASGGFLPGRFAGQFRVSTFSKTATVVETVATILEEIDRLREQPPSRSERDDSVSYIVGSFAAAQETPADLVDHLWRNRLHGLPKGYDSEYLRAVQAVRAETALATAQQLVDPKTLVVVVVGPAAELAPQLRAIAPVEVINPLAGPTGG